MADMKALAEHLNGLIVAANATEQCALAVDLENELRSILTIRNAPNDLQDQLADPLADGVPLADWCRKQIAEGCFTEKAFAPLVTIAELLDHLATMPEPLLLLVPRWFRVTDDGKIAVPWPLLSLGVINLKVPRLTELQRKEYASLIHPNLLRSLAGFDVSAAITYSLGLFLLDVFLDVRTTTRAELQDTLAKCRMHDSNIPPQIPPFFRKLMTAPVDKPRGYSCRQVVATILEAFRDSPFLCRPELDDGASHEWFGYSVPGMHKNGHTNEDRFAVRRIGKATWFLVADGVSTADLGSGEMAAEEIVRLLTREYSYRFDELAKQLTAKHGSVWPAKAEQFLAEFFRDANQRVVALVNELYAERRPGTSASAPMSSTLVSAVIACDQAIIRHVGDSTAWLFRPGPGVLQKLTSEHNAGGENHFSFETNDQEAALTRVVGACCFSQTNDAFVPVEQQAEVLHVQLRPGDLLLLASDGLIDGIDKPTEEAKIEMVEKELCRLSAADEGLPQLVRQLIALAEDGLSNDNITLSVVRVTTEEHRNG
jgi:serine/threonine protein phosphatase PrpC